MTPLHKVKRHNGVMRLWHVVFFAAVLVLLWSGVWIFNVHPRLYLGEVGHAGMPAIMSVDDVSTKGAPPRVEVQILGHRQDATDWLGSRLDLGDAGTFFLAYPMPADFQFGKNRSLHILAAEIFIIAWLLYAFYLFASGRLTQEWLPRRAEWKLSHFLGEVRDHVLMRRRPAGAALKYNVLQKISYLLLFWIAVPVLILSGLAMSNAMTVRWPLLIEMFGGRQTARTAHFLAAFLMGSFFLVHLFQVLVSGFRNHVRAVTTGTVLVEADGHAEEAKV